MSSSTSKNKWNGCVICKKFYASDDVLDEHLLTEHKRLILQVFKSIPPAILEEFISSKSLFEAPFKFHSSYCCQKAIKEEFEAGKRNLIYICHVCSCTYTNVGAMVACIQGHSHPISKELLSTVTEEPTVTTKDSTEIVIPAPIPEPVLGEIKEEPMSPVSFNDDQPTSPDSFKDEFDSLIKIEVIENTNHNSFEVTKPDHPGVMCDLCGKTFKTKRTLVEHHNKVHKKDNDNEEEKRKLICSICERVYSNKDSLRKHQKLVHFGSENFICDMCGFSCNRKENLYDHFQRKHLNLEFKCNQCPKVFRVNSDFKGHLKLHSAKRAEEIHKCPACDREFTMTRYLADHIRNIHEAKKEDRTYKCEDCSKEFSKKATYNKHRREKHIYTEKKLLCVDCGALFKYKSHLNTHIESKHSNETFVCSECPKVFKTKRTLAKHLKLHEDNRLGLEKTLDKIEESLPPEVEGLVPCQNV